MSYLVFARKYRPQTFADVIGQEHITRILEKTVTEGTPRHAYLFCGSRGTGKTTCARILARELNARAGKDASSLDLGLQSSLDIIEIDGASNNGVDDVRVLRENVRLVPMSGGYKVYIIDEVHMLSGAAFNALLKTLEEPPEHVIFIFATTEPSKLPPTVLSRCQRFDFKRIPVEKIVGCLKDICRKESITAEDEALSVIARIASGGMRDALSILDQLSSSGTQITLAQINDLFGLVESQQLAIFARALADKDMAGCLKVLDLVSESGKDMRHFSSDIVQYFRHVMLLKVGGKDLEGLVDLPKLQKEEITAVAAGQSMAWIIRAMDIIIASQDVARITEDHRLALELAAAKIMAEATPDAPAASAAARPVPAARPAPRAVSAASPSPSPVKPAPAAPVAARPSAGGILGNNKGILNIAPLVEPAHENFTGGQPLVLADLQERWNELTFALSQKKISLGTYLQPGRPVEVSGNRIMVAFSQEDAFNKEYLDTTENLIYIADVFSGVLGGRVQLAVKVVSELPGQDTPVADEAVEMFDGEIVNEWINDE